MGNGEVVIKTVIVKIVLLSFFYPTLVVANDVVKINFEKILKSVFSKPGSDIFLTYNGDLYLGISNDDFLKYESIIGPFKTKVTSPFRKVNINKIPKIPFKTNDNLSYFDPAIAKILKYTFDEYIDLKLVPSPYYAENDPYTYFYGSFNIALSSKMAKDTYSRADYEAFNGIAVKNEVLKLKPGITETLNYQTVPNGPTEDFLIKYTFNNYKQNKNIKDLFVQKATLGKLLLYQVGSKQSNFQTVFLKTSNENFINWQNKVGSNEWWVGHFGDLVEGAYCSAIVNYGDKVFLVLFHTDTVEVLPVWQASDSQ